MLEFSLFHLTWLEPAENNIFHTKLYNNLLVNTPFAGKNFLAVDQGNQHFTIFSFRLQHSCGLLPPIS